MRQEVIKQCACVSASSAEEFQERVNDILFKIDNPEIIMDKTTPYLCYVFYTITRRVPDELLEYLEMLDGARHHCNECSYFLRPTDNRRKVWGMCTLNGESARLDSRACVAFYLEHYKLPPEVRLIEAAE